MLRNQCKNSTDPETHTPDHDDDSISFDDVNMDIDVEGDVDVDVDVDVDKVASQKPHFLDYDAVPPLEFEESFSKALTLDTDKQSKRTPVKKDLSNHISNYKNDEVYVAGKAAGLETLGDFELTTGYGYTKKEFTQDDNTLHMKSTFDSVAFNICESDSEHGSHNRNTFEKPKHFLDENPIPPDYMFESAASTQENLKAASSTMSTQKVSTREQPQLPALNRLFENQTELTLPNSLRYQRVPKEGGTQCGSFESRYSSLHMTSSSDLDVSVVDPLGPKVECVYSLLSMLGSNNPMEMSKKFHDLSRNPETCVTLRRSGCIPLLVQMIHSEGEEDSALVRKWAGMALHNVVVNSSHPDDKTGRREIKVLRLLDQIIDYCNFLKTLLQSGGEAIADDSDRHPLAAMSSLMKVSFDEEHRHAMCELGALQAIPSLVHLDHAVHGPKSEDQCCNSLRRYALMALTNLTFGDENNKALLCSQKLFMEALVAQLNASAPDDLLQVTASVLRNLSWRADSNMKATLNEIGTVTALAQAAMKNKNENTLKAILSALWNLSAHCSTNKAEFCAVDGALAFLVSMLTYEGPSKTLKIIENAGGILRNVSSHIAVCEHYRQILREHNCLAILLQQLKSESLTVVSNSCGTLWNLSARCPEDQKFLWDNGAVSMLRSLIHSKHAMISEGSSSALKNLLNFNRSTIQNQNQNLDPIARSMGLKKLPTLNARKQKALEQELKEKEHVETCDNLDAVTNTSFIDKTSIEKAKNQFDQVSATQRRYRFIERRVSSDRGISKSSTRLTRSAAAMLTKSESGDSVFSAKSDSVYENVMRSRSASDENRQTMKNMSFAPPRTAFALQADIEPTEEQPIDYSVKYNENLIKTVDDNESVPEGMTAVSDDVLSTEAGASTTYSTYQETDLDQPTDFSLRYPENQSESDVDVILTDSINETVASAPTTKEKKTTTTAITTTSNETVVKQVNNGNEILLILVEDSVKCYQTEDTPYVISNAASVTDLRQSKIENLATSNIKKEKKQPPPPPVHSNTTYGCAGTYTPEKPTNYCEEGTPGYFSRYDSLNSLDDELTLPQKQLPLGDIPHKESVSTIVTVVASKEIKVETTVLPPSSKDTSSLLQMPMIKQHTGSAAIVNPIVSSSVNSAQETPLMFSRHSSMDSLIEEEIASPCCDDKSSVVSDFSRLASGVISPSEIPDSPSQQSVPHSPRRNSISEQTAARKTDTNRIGGAVEDASEVKTQSQSIFEDNLNTFHVENTPAQFSCATSLSNLSFADDDNSPQKSILQREQQKQPEHANPVISEGEEDDEMGTNDDDLLLASCINIGMNRASSKTKKTIKDDLRGKDTVAQISVASHGLLTTDDDDEPKAYFTEDTPALLSKTGSNTNLSALSSLCSGGDNKTKNEDYASTLNCTEGNTVNHISADVLKPNSSIQSDGEVMKTKINHPVDVKQFQFDPIEMLRRGGNTLPPYLPISSNDEMNSKYLVENSPCNFSINSGLSNLTIGSSLVGPAVQLKESVNEAKDDISDDKGQAQIPPVYRHDSLSSLSIDSNEDDTNLLSQAIAAGCNRPKSNLGFSSTSSHAKQKPSNSFFASQQTIQLNYLTTSESSLHTASALSKHQNPKPKPLSTKQPNQSTANGNDSFSSVDDSSDSNDNQSKSLFELCIQTGMRKLRSSRTSYKDDPLDTRKNDKNRHAATSTQSNPNLKQFGLPIVSNQRRNASSSHHRERDRKDEKLLQECISTGISKKISGSAVKADNDRSTNNVAIGNEATNVIAKPREAFVAANAVSKNGEATSAAVLELYQQMVPTTYPNVPSTIAPGVEMTNNGTIINTRKNQNATRHISPDDTNVQRNQNLDDDESILIFGNTPEIMINTGCKQLKNVDTMSMELTCSYDNSESVTSGIASKHKDPDLMLKSVERLTLEFVSSAELLRTNSSNNSNECYKRNGSISIGGTNSNNTWSEDTHPNDVSFPSVSVSVPIVASLKYDDTDDEELASNGTQRDNDEYLRNYPILTQPNSLETDTDTLVNCNSEEYYPINDMDQSTSSSGINFRLGGEVQSAAAAAGSKLQFNNMTISTIFAIEARALAENLQPKDEINNADTFSLNSLDLDNIGPPSGMDSLNISGCYQEMTAGAPISSIQRTIQYGSPCLSKSPKYPRKSLPANIVAKRALGQLPCHLSGSAESVNSSCNLLDNIKPPSLMDELLDSMISVASIQSEVADCESMATTMPSSHYQTAADMNSDYDDNTITLQSCNNDFMSHRDDDFEFNEDDEDASIKCETPLPFDEMMTTSAESTPQKSLESPSNGGKRTLTPKQKRKFAKDRYKTYTIAAGVAPTTHTGHGIPIEEDEVLQIEIEEIGPKQTPPSSGCISANRRRTSQDRYKTQTIIFPQQITVPPPGGNLVEGTTNELNFIAKSISKTTNASHHMVPMTSLQGKIRNHDMDAHAVVANDESRPRLHKPDENMTENAEEVEKIVRGRKKPVYVSPYGKHYQRTNSIETPAQTAMATRKLTTPATAVASTTKKQNLNVTAPAAFKVAQKKKVNNIVPVNDAPDVQDISGNLCQLTRQGTFVKDEPTVAPAEVPVIDTPVSPSVRTSKLPTKRLQTVPRQSSAGTKVTTIRKIPLTNLGKRHPPTVSTPQRSNSITSMRVTSTAARIAVLSSRVSVTTPPSRSNSHINSGSAQSAASKINQAQSRIASIWKRVDESKHTQKPSNLANASSTIAFNKLKTSQQRTKSSNGLIAQKPRTAIDRATTSIENIPSSTKLSTFNRSKIIGIRKETATVGK